MEDKPDKNNPDANLETLEMGVIPSPTSPGKEKTSRTKPKVIIITPDQISKLGMAQQFQEALKSQLTPESIVETRSNNASFNNDIDNLPVNNNEKDWKVMYRMRSKLDVKLKRIAKEKHPKRLRLSSTTDDSNEITKRNKQDEEVNEPNGEAVGEKSQGKNLETSSRLQNLLLEEPQSTGIHEIDIETALIEEAETNSNTENRANQNPLIEYMDLKKNDLPEEEELNISNILSKEAKTGYQIGTSGTPQKINIISQEIISVPPSALEQLKNRKISVSQNIVSTSHFPVKSSLSDNNMNADITLTLTEPEKSVQNDVHANNCEMFFDMLNEILEKGSSVDAKTEDFKIKVLDKNVSEVDEQKICDDITKPGTSNSASSIENENLGKDSKTENVTVKDYRNDKTVFEEDNRNLVDSSTDLNVELDNFEGNLKEPNDSAKNISAAVAVESKNLGINLEDDNKSSEESVVNTIGDRKPCNISKEMNNCINLSDTDDIRNSSTDEILMELNQAITSSSDALAKSASDLILYRKSHNTSKKIKSDTNLPKTEVFSVKNKNIEFSFGENSQVKEGFNNANMKMSTTNFNENKNVNMNIQEDIVTTSEESTFITAINQKSDNNPENLSTVDMPDISSIETDNMQTKLNYSSPPTETVNSTTATIQEDTKTKPIVIRKTTMINVDGKQKDHVEYNKDANTNKETNLTSNRITYKKISQKHPKGQILKLDFKGFSKPKQTINSKINILEAAILASMESIDNLLISGSISDNNLKKSNDNNPSTSETDTAKSECNEADTISEVVNNKIDATPKKIESESVSEKSPQLKRATESKTLVPEECALNSVLDCNSKLEKSCNKSNNKTRTKINLENTPTSNEFTVTICDHRTSINDKNNKNLSDTQTFGKRKSGIKNKIAITAKNIIGTESIDKKSPKLKVDTGMKTVISEESDVSPAIDCKLNPQKSCGECINEETINPKNVPTLHETPLSQNVTCAISNEFTVTVCEQRTSISDKSSENLSDTQISDKQKSVIKNKINTCTFDKSEPGKTPLNNKSNKKSPVKDQDDSTKEAADEDTTKKVLRNRTPKASADATTISLNSKPEEARRSVRKRKAVDYFAVHYGENVQTGKNRPNPKDVATSTPIKRKIGRPRRVAVNDATFDLNKDACVNRLGPAVLEPNLDKRYPYIRPKGFARMILLSDDECTEEVNAEKTKEVNAEKTEEVNAEEVENVNAEKAEEVNVEKTEEINAEKTEEINAEKTENVNAEKMEEVIAEKTEEVMVKEKEKTEIASVENKIKRKPGRPPKVRITTDNEVKAVNVFMQFSSTSDPNPKRKKGPGRVSDKNSISSMVLASLFNSLQNQSAEKNTEGDAQKNDTETPAVIIKGDNISVANETAPQENSPPGSANEATCAVCNKVMAKSNWPHHKLRNHNNLAWKVGDAPLDINDKTFVMSVLNDLYKRKKPLYCSFCDVSKKSVLGFLSHQSMCQKSAKEIDALKVKCKLCDLEMLPVSYSTHRRYCKENPENMHQKRPPPKTKKAKPADEALLSNGKRRAAASKALGMIKCLEDEDVSATVNSKTWQVSSKGALYQSKSLRNKKG